ncbi:hypothetical protein D3C76_1011130 [compost metagenome]
MHYRRETYEYRGFFARAEHGSPGQCAEILEGGELTMGASAAGMYHPLGDAFAVEALEFLNQLHVLQQGRASRTGSLRVLVFTYRCTVVARQWCCLQVSACEQRRAYK